MFSNNILGMKDKRQEKPSVISQGHVTIATVGSFGSLMCFYHLSTTTNHGKGLNFVTLFKSLT